MPIAAAARAGAQHGGERGAVGDPAGGHHRERRRAREDPQQREQPDPAFVGPVVDEPAAMPAGLAALHGQPVRAGLARDECFRARSSP